MPTSRFNLSYLRRTPGDTTGLWSALLRRDHDRLALITPDARWVWRDVLRAVAARVATYQREGVSGTVVLYGSSQFELVVHVLALSWCRLPFLCIPRSLPHVMMRAWVAGCGAQWCVGETGSLPDPLLGLKLCLTTHAQDALNVDSDLRVRASPQRHYKDESLFMIIGGSGTSGQSKLIAVTSGQMHERLRITGTALHLSPDDVSLGWVHCEYASGLHRTLAALYSGGACCLGDGPPSHLLPWALEQRVTVMSSAVVHAQALTAFAYRSARPLWPYLRLFTVAGSVVSESLRREVRAVLSPHLAVVYGTNECWYVSLTSPTSSANEDNSIGWPAPGVEVRLVGADDSPTPVGSVGQIQVRSRALFAGYLGTDAAMAAREADGWFRTGDLARLLPTGEILFCGRADNMMMSNGVNVHPQEIEDALLSFDGVTEAVAFPLPHAHRLPACAIGIGTGGRIDRSALQQHLRRWLGFRAPRAIVVFAALPRSIHGKVLIGEIMRQLPEDIPGFTKD